MLFSVLETTVQQGNMPDLKGPGLLLCYEVKFFKAEKQPLKFFCDFFSFLKLILPLMVISSHFRSCDLFMDLMGKVWF